MNFSSLLIVTYGRTGSTLLMGLLNTIPNVLICGENMNLCNGLFVAYEALRSTKQRTNHRIPDSTMPFFGAQLMDEEAFLNDARQLLKHQLLPNDRQDVECWGFKEIRYTAIHLNHDLIPYLDFMARLMPTPGFIFLTRDKEQVADSAFWKNSEKADVYTYISLFEQDVKEWSADRNDCFRIDYEEITKKSKKLWELFDFIKAKIDLEMIEKVMAREHSYAGKPKNMKNVVRR